MWSCEVAVVAVTVPRAVLVMVPVSTAERRSIPAPVLVRTAPFVPRHGTEILKVGPDDDNVANCGVRAVCSTGEDAGNRPGQPADGLGHDDMGVEARSAVT